MMNLSTHKTTGMKLMPILACALITFSCSNSAKETPATTLSTEKVDSLLPKKESFNDTLDGKPVALYVIRNSNGLTAAITNFGGRVVSLVVPDENGEAVDVSIGFGSLEGYLGSTEAYFGAAIGRIANRVANANFQLDGKTYQLFANNGPNTLHGGNKGFQDVVWDANQPNDSTLVLTYLSPDGEGGFPGNLNVQLTYTMTTGNALRFDFEATTDKRTPVNLTNHAFFNLNGEHSGTINNHVLQIHADNFTAVDSNLIPFGEHQPVKDTPFDFLSETVIGERVDDAHEQLLLGKGYDHNFVLNKGDDYGLAARATGDKTGIVLEVYTNQPGLQFYGGNFLEGTNTLKSGVTDDFRTSFCLETQQFPDAVNQQLYPSIILEPGDVYRNRSEYVFSVR